MRQGSNAAHPLHFATFLCPSLGTRVGSRRLSARRRVDVGQNAPPGAAVGRMFSARFRTAMQHKWKSDSGR
jgi:hypothetical protein